MAATIDIKDRFRGSLLGLAVGDAVGTTVESLPRGSFPPVTDMVGGGRFNLLAGQVSLACLHACTTLSVVKSVILDPRSLHMLPSLLFIDIVDLCH